MGINPEIVKKSLDPMENVRLLTVTGGPAPGVMRDMISRRRRELEKDRAGIAGLQKNIADATRRLLKAAEELAKA